MRSSVLGVLVGASKMLRVLMYSHVVLILKESFTKNWDAEELGVGLVERNIALLTTIPKLEKDIKIQRIITTPFVVNKRRDSKKKSIVLVDIADIAEKGGKEYFSKTEMRGGGSTYQHYTYTSPELAPSKQFSLIGGATRKNYRTVKKGGFYPSLMGGVLSNGPLLVPATLAQAARLLRKNSRRMATRKRRFSKKRKASRKQH
jgi:hypothetical protein